MIRYPRLQTVGIKGASEGRHRPVFLTPGLLMINPSDHPEIPENQTVTETKFFGESPCLKLDIMGPMDKRSTTYLGMQDA